MVCRTVALLSLLALWTPPLAAQRSQQPSTPATPRPAPPSQQRDARAATAAVLLAERGKMADAFRTLGRVRHPQRLAEAIRRVASATDDRPNEPSGAGGAINFGPLMELIQTTIAPDSWVDAGGFGSIFPYTGGITVAPDGLVQPIDPPPAQAGDLLEDIAVMLLDSDDGVLDAPGATDADWLDAWRKPAALRCVSLQRLAEQLAHQRLSGEPIGADMRHLAGLGRVRFLVIDRQADDAILVGTVGGIELHEGRFRDRRSGAAPLRLDHLTACIESVLSRQPLGCSIDPSPQALVEAARAAEQIRQGQVDTARAATALGDALGEQAVRVFGIRGDTPLAYLMVETDRHMKRLALGLEPMPAGVANYLDYVDRHIRRGPPDGQLLRFWFTAQPARLRRSSDGRLWQLGGRMIRLASQTELASAERGRVAAADDPRLRGFTAEFDRHFPSIARKHPAYASLHAVYHAAAVCELIRRSGGQQWLGQWLPLLLLDDAAHLATPAPRRVESVTVRHSVRAGSKRHVVLLASGGVHLDPAEVLADDVTNYPPLDEMAASVIEAARPAHRWWWDLDRQ